ncbi:hypothetical protein DFH09DRAFT_92839 [Mycena vulgaris]|nr:hypothetical protein DFH09DRAFT_92839 [Mycena vulgaris]
MSIPPATPFPALDDPDGDASPQKFLHSLSNLVAQSLSGDVRIPAENKDAWVTIVTRLSEQFFASFPSTDKVEWHDMHEKVRLATATLDIIRRVSSRVEGVFHGPGHLAQRIFARLLNFCIVVEMWLDVEVEPMQGLPSPQELADDALQTTLLVLRSLSGAVVHSTEISPRMMFLVQMVSCISTCFVVTDQRLCHGVNNLARYRARPPLQPWWNV